MSAPLVTNILASYDQVSPAVLAAGEVWYDLAFTTCELLAWRSGHSVTAAVVAAAHLSPRMRWSDNVAALEALLAGQAKPGAVLTRSWANAAAALAAPDPLATFGQWAYKTRAFAAALLGDRDTVVVDTWAARVAGVPVRVVKHYRGYELVASAYRLAAAQLARHRPRELQAITWCHVRGAID